MSTLEETPRRSIQRIDDRRKAAFLEALRQTGSFRWAATIASPHLHGRERKSGRRGHGYESFRDAMRRDPIFAAAVHEAQSYALGRAEQILAERMLTPDTRPIIDKNGVVVAVATDHRNANTLLLRFLERHDGGWAQKKHVAGEVAHQHQHQHVHTLSPGEPGFTVTASDIRALPEERQRLLLSLLDEVDEAREGRELTDARVVATVPAAPSEPAQPDHPALPPA